MIENFVCPICKHDLWEQIEKFSFSPDDGKNYRSTKWTSIRRKINNVGRILIVAKPKKHVVNYGHLNAYQKLRRDVLFNVWFPGAKEVHLTSIFCKKCGFICYTPRPEEKDVSNKYRYLKQFEPDQGGQTGYDTYARKLDNDRAERIFSQCTKYLSRNNLDILDSGGGNGKILTPFLEKKHNCFIIDYNDQPIEGVIKLADDINGYQGGKKFDLILCSHVLEHVSDFSSLVNKLYGLIKPGGIIYAEVPQEIWAGLRIDADPVTHINFFTFNSFRNLFLVNGFQILEANQEISNFGRGYLEVIWLVAKSDGKGADKLLPSDTKALLFPARIYSIKKLYRWLVTPIIRRIKDRFIQ